MTRLIKSLRANITFIRFLSSVDAQVVSQMTSCRKALLANITLVWFLSSVNTHVCFQTTRSRKSLLANITFVRPLPLRCSRRKSIALFVSYLLIFFRFFVRYFHAQPQLFFFFFSPLSATAHHHDRLRVDRPLRIRTLPSHRECARGDDDDDDFYFEARISVCMYIARREEKWRTSFFPQTSVSKSR